MTTAPMGDYNWQRDCYIMLNDLNVDGQAKKNNNSNSNKWAITSQNHVSMNNKTQAQANRRRRRRRRRCHRSRLTWPRGARFDALTFATASLLPPLAYPTIRYALSMCVCCQTVEQIDGEAERRTDGHPGRQPGQSVNAY